MGFYFMTDTSDDIDVVYTFDVHEMSREQLITEVLSGRAQIQKSNDKISRLKRFWRMQEDFYYPTQEQLENGNWTLEDLKPPSHERLLSWYEQSRQCWAEVANWFGF